MKIKERRTNGVTILDLSGDLHGGAENMALLERLDELGRIGRLDSVLNLEGVRFIASNGLGIMVRARARYAHHGGMLKICGASDRHLSLFEVTRLDLLFDVYATCDEALRAFRIDGAVTEPRTT